MFLDYAENIVMLLANLLALLLCLFQYISSRHRAWVFATAFFISSLLSCYYWTAYLVVMGDAPNVSSLISDSGWNIAFFILFIFIIKLKSKDERRFFHPLMLLPVPLAIMQLAMYLPYGQVFLNLYQVGILSVIAILCLQSFCWYKKNKHNAACRPYIAISAFVFVICEFGMWIFSFLENLNLYYLFSFACSINYPCMVWAVFLTYRDQNRPMPDGIDRKYQRILKTAYFIMLVICCAGGMFLGVWMRNMLSSSLENPSGSNIYDIIPVILYFVSLVLVAFAIVIIFVVSFVEKIAENNELRQARIIADHSNTAKSQFLANMSHEIRTPINTVLGMNEMILRESGEEAILGYAANIKVAGRTLLSLINSILDFSKIEEGRMEIMPVEYDTSSFINNIITSVSERAKDKGLKLIVDVDEQLPCMLYGDDVRLSQVIINILTNAVKYTKEGSVSFSVSVIARGKDSIDLKVSVKDTGIGIRDEDLPRLFESFERLDEEQNRNIEGTGLGMAIVTRLLKMMGSKLTVESVYGKGSVFSFTILQKIIDDTPIGDYSKRLKVSHERGNETLFAEDARVLVVDDNEMNLTVAKNLLKLFSITPDLANSGLEAIALLRTKQYDIILLDHMMPEMDGIEALSEMKKQSLLEEGTKVIALTANAIMGAKDHYLAAGFDAYLSKPVEVGRLEDLLIRFLPPEVCHIRKNESIEGNIGAAAFPEEAVEESKEASSDDFPAAIQELGYNTASGLRYAASDKAFYLELLQNFADRAEDGIRGIREAYEGNDIRGYQIKVHSLKSTARQIGADQLADLAFEQEKAAKEGDLEAIRDGVDELLTCYERAGKELKSAAHRYASPPRPAGVTASAGPDTVAKARSEAMAYTGIHAAANTGSLAAANTGSLAAANTGSLAAANTGSLAAANTGSHTTVNTAGSAGADAAVRAPVNAEAPDKLTGQNQVDQRMDQQMEAADVIRILEEAASAVDDFEAEKAAGLLLPLRDASIRGIPLNGQIAEISDALRDFDTAAAAGKLSSLLGMIKDDGHAILLQCPDRGG